MEARDAEAVNGRLLSLGLNPVKVKKKPLDIMTLIPQLGSGVTGKDILIFTRQFATMIDAGLPLVQCLDILGVADGQPRLQEGGLRRSRRRSRPARPSPTRSRITRRSSTSSTSSSAPRARSAASSTPSSTGSRPTGEEREAEAQGEGRDDLPDHRARRRDRRHRACSSSRSPRRSRRCSRTSGSALPGPTQVVVDISDWLQHYFIHLTLGIVARSSPSSSSLPEPEGPQDLRQGACSRRR